MTNGRDHAFPVQRNDKDSGADGLTKREHFAAMAMQALLSNAFLFQMQAEQLAEGEKVKFNAGAESVLFANELIEALNKEAK